MHHSYPPTKSGAYTLHPTNISKRPIAAAASAISIHFSALQYAQVAGIVGVVAYGISCGLPILMIGWFGGKITRDLPHVLSLGDFVGWRFGPIAKTLLFILTMFMMCIFVLAEYTTIGTIFAAFVGTLDWPIIVVVGVLTLSYTAYGGLAVSIATDQVQGVASMLLALVLTIYVAVTYRCVRGGCVGWGVWRVCVCGGEG